MCFNQIEFVLVSAKVCWALPFSKSATLSGIVSVAHFFLYICYLVFAILIHLACFATIAFFALFIRRPWAIAAQQTIFHTMQQQTDSQKEEVKTKNKSTRKKKREMFGYYLILFRIYWHWRISFAFWNMCCAHTNRAHAHIHTHIFDRSCDKNWYFGCCDLNEMCLNIQNTFL